MKTTTTLPTPANIGDGNQEGAKPMIDFSNITHCYVRNDPWRRPIVKVSLKTVLFGPADERIDGTWVPCTRPEFTEPLRVRKSDFYGAGFFEATDSDGDLVLYRTDNPY